MDIILASASPRRLELFKLITAKFTAVPSNVEEITPAGLDPKKCPEFLAIKKAEEIAARFSGALVIGCDTSVILGACILDKPANRADARRMLKLLSGRVHEVITGCCLSFNGRYDTFRVKTEVEFYLLSDEEIESYIDTQEPFDKAGAYAIQGRGALLVNGINGDYYNVMGLPVARLKREIAAFINNHSC